jgi:4-hydroxy-2-oxoheptanedioate aldolase
MRNNHTLHKLRNNETACGIWLASHHPITARLLAMQGAIDWILIDGEHSPVDTSALALCCGAISDASQGKCTPLARVANGTIDQIKRALDSGAQGVLVPLVSTAEDAENVVRFSRYPPDGIRGMGGLLAAQGFAMTRAEYSQRANREVLVSIQIETKQAIDNIDEICSVKGLDAVFIGPNDLHVSYGLPPSYWSDAPEFQNAVQKVLDASKRHNMTAGILCGTQTQAKMCKELGFTYLGIGSDLPMLLGAVGATYSHVTDTPEPAGGWSGAIRKDIV